MSNPHDPISNGQPQAAGAPDDLLDRSIAALRDGPVPQGPSARTAADTLAALRRATGERPVDTAPTRAAPRRRDWAQRVLAMTFTQRLAAAVMLTLGGITMWFMFTLFSSVSYAQVADRIRAVHSMTLTATMTMPMQKEPTSFKMLFKDPGHLRHEGPGNRITVSDQSTGRTLSLDPDTKTATVITLQNQPAGVQGDMVTEFRKLADAKGEPIGERQIGDVKAKGFKVQAGPRSFSVWADARTGVPLRIEMDLDMGGQAITMVMSDFNFDVNLDDALFSLDPPKDYTLTTSTLKVNLDLEQNVITVLRAYATANDGRFPAALSDMAELVKGLKITGDDTGKPSPELMQTMSAAGAIMGTTFSMQKGVDYDYTPDDARLGDADKRIFWHHDKAKGAYRAITADLTAKDVTAESLGIKPATQPATE